MCIRDRSSAGRNDLVFARQVEANVEDWRNWAIGAEIDPSIIAYISHRPDALFVFNSESRSFATPRTWQYVHEIISSNPEEDLIMSMVSGAIGEELAASYLGFRLVASQLPDLDAILEGKCSDVPSDPSALHILTIALTMRVNDYMGSKKLNNLVAYSLKLPGEFAVMIIQDLRARKIELDHLESWPLWMRQFNTLLR